MSLCVLGARVLGLLIVSLLVMFLLSVSRGFLPVVVVVLLGSVLLGLVGLGAGLLAGGRLRLVVIFVVGLLAVVLIISLRLHSGLRLELGAIIFFIVGLVLVAFRPLVLRLRLAAALPRLGLLLLVIDLLTPVLSLRFALAAHLKY